MKLSLRRISAVLLAASMIMACASIASLGDARMLEDTLDAQLPAAPGDGATGDSPADVATADGDAERGDGDAEGRDAGSDALSEASQPDAAPPVTGPDLAYPAVVALRHKAGTFFCSGTLISPQVVLTSARCFPAFANGCAPLHGSNGEADSNEVVLSGSGVLGASDNVARDIDDLEAAPSSYPIRRNDCPSGTQLSCGGADGGRDLGDGRLGLRVGSDLLLVHLASPAPPSIRPIPVLTSLRDDIFDRGSTIHAALDTNPAFSSRARAPLAHIAGWGTPACTGVERRAGLAQLEAIGPNPGDWHKGCAEWFACDLSKRVDLGCTLTDMVGGVADSQNWYATSEVRISNTSSNGGAFDGPIPPSGDLGSPVLLDGVDLAGVPVTYAIGTLSVPPQPNDCAAPPRGHASSRYSASFTPENGAWIEKALQYWSGLYYPWNGTWAAWRTTDTGRGPIATGAGAESQGTGRIDSFFVGADRNIYANMWNGHAWYVGVGPINWNIARQAYETVTSAPAACSWGPDRMDLVATIADGSVMHWWYVDGWLNESLGGRALPGTGPTITTWGPSSTLSAFVIGADSHLYWNNNTALPDQKNPGGWTGWVDLGGYVAHAISSPAAVAWAPGRLDVFVQQADGSVAHLFQDADAAQLGWQVSVLPSPPIVPGSGFGVASWMPGRLDVVGRGAADGTSITWFGRSSQGWAANAARTILPGGAPASIPAIASMYPGRLDLFVQTPDGGSSFDHSWFGSP